METVCKQINIANCKSDEVFVVCLNFILRRLRSLGGEKILGRPTEREENHCTTDGRAGGKSRMMMIFSLNAVSSSGAARSANTRKKRKREEEDITLNLKSTDERNR